MSTATNPKIDFPKILKPLFDPMRYKILYGGRGGLKSWGVARALLILGTKQPLRILCARELQKSIKDSVHRLLSDQINLMGLQSFYKVEQATIKGMNGTEFFFEGLRHNTTQIKSYEGIDVLWVEEAALVSKSSWDVVIPTIRKDGSEIWATFNPELEEDETYQRFVIDPPDNAWVIKLGYQDNPWFPEVLRLEMEALKKKDFDSYLNVWEGNCLVALEGAIYAKELREATEQGRICRVPHNPSELVNVFWDLGYSDQTALWFIQKAGFEWHAIDYYSNSQEFIPHYALELQKRPYQYGMMYLPHDGTANHLGSKSIEKQLRDLNFQTEVVPKLGITDGINATRTVFPTVYFDEKKCADGLQSLRRYRYKKDPDTGRVEKNPYHDIHSNGADAFRTFGTAPTIMTEAYLGPKEGVIVNADFDPFERVSMT